MSGKYTSLVNLETYLQITPKIVAATSRSLGPSGMEPSHMLASREEFCLVAFVVLNWLDVPPCYPDLEAETVVTTYILTAARVDISCPSFFSPISRFHLRNYIPRPGSDRWNELRSSSLLKGPLSKSLYKI